MREGVESISPDELDDEFLSLGSHVIGDLCQRYEPWYGEFRGIVIYHEKISVLMMRLGGSFLVIAFDRDASADVIRGIADEVYDTWKRSERPSVRASNGRVFK
jgi:hypothetical protein